MQGDGFATKRVGIMEVAMWLCALLLVGLWSNLGLDPTMLCQLQMGVLIICKVVMQGPRDQFKETSVFDFNYIYQMFNSDYGIFSHFLSLYICLAQRLIWFLDLKKIINLEAKRMCNSLKCWFKHPLP